MLQTWAGSRTYSYCFLIPPLFFYLVWIRRRATAKLVPSPNFWGLPVLGGLALIWILGNLGDVRVVQEFAIVAMLIALVWTLLGNDVVRALQFPLLFLFFAVPFGVSLIRPLQNFTAWFVIHALNASNVPALLENHTLSLPSGTWTVAEACSGIRFLLSSVVLGAVFASLAYRSRKRQLAFMVASVIAPVVGNGLRAYSIVLLAYLTHNRLAAGVDHIVYGTFFSVFTELVLISVGLRWRQPRAPDDATAINSGNALEALGNYKRSPSMATTAAVILALALILPAPLVASHLWDRVTAATVWPEPPVIVSTPWQTAETSDTNWAPELHGTDKEFSQSYQNERNRVDLHWVASSGRSRMDLAGNYSSVDDPKLWSLASADFGNVTLNGQPTSVQRNLIQAGTDFRTVLTWYWISGEYTASPARVRFLQAKARLFGKPATVAIMSLGTVEQADPSAAERVLQDFLLHASFLVPGGTRPRW